MVCRVSTTPCLHLLPPLTSPTSGSPMELSHVRHERYNSYHSVELSLSVLLSAFCEPGKSKVYNCVFILLHASWAENLKCSYFVSVHCYLAVALLQSVGQHIYFTLYYRLRACFFSSYLIKWLPFEYLHWGANGVLALFQNRSWHHLFQEDSQSE